MSLYSNIQKFEREQTGASIREITLWSSQDQDFVSGHMHSRINNLVKAYNACGMWL